MTKETLLLYHPESDSYMIGEPKWLKNNNDGLEDVSGYENHEHDAAVFNHCINLPVNCQTLVKSGSEHAHQMAVFCWLAYIAKWYPMVEYAYAVPNGGSRGDSELSRKIAGGKLKAEGVKSGVPDWMLPFPKFHVKHNAMYAGLYIEMKDASGGDGGSKDQKKYIEFLNKVGYAAQVANGYEEACKAVTSYLELERRLK